ncbi:MAG: tyrosine-type recombinase/integrase [Cyanobacteria bacterium P01_D01_bin.128]
MYSSNQSRKKAPKGSVKVKNSNERLQLVFSYGGKRHYISTGLANSVTNRKLADLKAKEIEKDILYERFDHTLARYKNPNSSALSTVTPTVTPIAKPQMPLDELWERYVTFKRPQVSQTTVARDYARYRSHIAKLPTKDLTEAVIIRDYLMASTTANAAKRILINLSACCDWARKSGLIETNPFTGMSAEITIPKSSSDDMDIEPFSTPERDKIIEMFSLDRYYIGYTQLIKFLFFTGCRPSEAIALQWKHINSYVHFEQAVTFSEEGLTLKKGLKTQEKRRFPINQQLSNILNAIKPEDCSTEDYLFPSPEGKFIDFNNFRNRAWKSILTKCGIPYRKLYQTRHTFITLCLEAGIDAKDVARLVGNSPEVIYRHYAGNKRNLQVPEL